MSTTQTRYAKSADVHIAYQVAGEGQVDLVMVNGWVTNLELIWEDPGWSAFFRRLRRFGGQEIKTIGDGFLATFDGPARAIRCALATVEASRETGLILRAGLHTGECERRDGDISGIAVHTGARVAALAASGEVLVSRTVKDLVAGSGLRFEDRGTRSLKGVPDVWQLYAATG